MRSVRGIVAVATLCVALGGAAPREGIEAAARGADYRGLMAAARIPGLTVARIESGRLAEVERLGVAAGDSGEPLSPETLFEAASLSKPVFATAVLRLAERGELDLDRPLRELLPFERLDDPRSGALTARIVLSHRTGLPNWGGERLELAFAPGERFGYSGEGYVYLQRVVEEVTGLDVDELARREVFELLGMKRSRFLWPEGEAPVLAMPHDELGDRLEKRQAHEGNAAASLHTTAREYARFVVSWMAGELLEPETITAALSPVARMRGDERGGNLPEAAWKRVAWGLGWGLQLAETAGAEPIVWHWGDNGPFKAFVAFRRAAGSGIVWFANASNGLAIGRALTAGVVGDMEPAFAWAGYPPHDAPGFAERLAALGAVRKGRHAEAIGHYRAALAADPGDAESQRRIEWLGDLLAVAEEPVAVPADRLRAFAGSYGPRTLTVEDERLVYQREGRSAFPLIPLAETLFALEGEVDFRIEVALDEQGAPTALVGLYVNGDSDESPRDPG